MLYWVIYDIKSDKVRSKISSKCKNYGLIRVQKSSFIGGLTRNRMEMLFIEIKDLNLDKGDCVFIIPTCKQCFETKNILGDLDEEGIKQKDFVIVQND
ncbi:MAG: CRISPR-associated endonuclease Cas2 [Candidatus Pacearchaeota archaeon]|nr:CRISPR-associated endonuclease Cas2 [Candidatus Pacearchaeota archaeon]